MGFGRSLPITSGYTKLCRTNPANTMPKRDKILRVRFSQEEIDLIKAQGKNLSQTTRSAVLAGVTKIPF